MHNKAWHVSLLPYRRYEDSETAQFCGQTCHLFQNSQIIDNCREDGVTIFAIHSEFGPKQSSGFRMLPLPQMLNREETIAPKREDRVETEQFQKA
eukprot:m.471890 g.471890  ORF g.471890 m.471890 type:complete len:95 (-) comp57107_c1_seq11:3178-3462(-)